MQEWFTRRSGLDNQWDRVLLIQRGLIGDQHRDREKTHDCRSRVRKKADDGRKGSMLWRLQEEQRLASGRMSPIFHPKVHHPGMMHLGVRFRGRIRLSAEGVALCAAYLLLDMCFMT